MPPFDSSSRLLFPRRLPAVLVGIALLAAAVFAPASLAAAEPAALTVERFGWDGVYQVGAWNPLRVSLPYDGAPALRFEIEAPDADGNRPVATLTAAPLDGTDPPQFDLRVRLGRIAPEVVIRVYDGDEQIAQTLYRPSQGEDRAAADLALRLRTQLIGLVAPNEEFLQAATDAVATDDPELGRDRRIVTFETFADLPTDVVALESLDVLVLPGRFDLSPQTGDLLRQWVERGGHLVAAVGTEVDAYSGSPLAEWVPVQLGKEVGLADVGEIESFATRSSRIIFSARLRATTLAEFPGDALIAGREGAFAASFRYGFGRLSVLGLDLHKAPLVSWKSLPQFLQPLMFPRPPRARAEEQAQSQQLADSGISELSTQLLFAQQQFPAVRRSSTWTVIGLLFLYVLVVGPLDYYVVHKLWKRPEVTWVTFPLLVIGAAAVTLWGGQSQNASPLSVNQVDLVDVNEELDFVRSRSWATLYSPATQRLAVEAVSAPVAPSSAAAAPLLTWDAVPEDGFRGLYRQSGMEFVRPEYHFAAAGNRIDDLPVGQWSTRSLRAEATTRGAGLVVSDLEATSLGNLSGTLEHRLPGRLTQWLVAYRTRVYFPRATSREPEGLPLEPGRVYEIGRNDLTAARDLKGFLTGSRQEIVTRQRPGSSIEEDRVIVRQQDYDIFATEPAGILRMLSFHQAAGGKSYTSLDNFALDDVDWSDLLDGRHAVLFGVLESEPEAAALKWTVNGEPATDTRRTVVVRLYLPVQLLDDARRALPDLK